MTAIAVLITVLKVGGFVGGAVLGGRTAGKFAQTKRWHAFVLAVLILSGVTIFMIAHGGVVPNERVRLIGLSALGCALGLIVKARRLIMQESDPIN